VPAAPRAADSPQLVPLGKHLKTCRIGAGTGMHGWKRQTNQTRMGKEKFLALLQYEYDQGIRFFDCADLYGTHEFVAEALKGKPRDSYQVSTKLWFNEDGLPEAERPDADVCIKHFLKELRADCIDLAQIHCMTSATWPAEMRKQMDIMEKLKEQGLIKAHGVSCHSLAALKAAAAEPWVDVIHARINPFGVVMDAPTADVVPVLKQAHDAGKGIIGMKINGEGKLTPAQLGESVKFALTSGIVDVLIAGFEKTTEVDVFTALVKEHLPAKT
jgi:aryl-alcohol dehydrogenase-like predicted oxidoreductase